MVKAGRLQRLWSGTVAAPRCRQAFGVIGAGGEVPVEVRQVSETTREADGYDFLISRAEQQFRALNPSVV